jgi:hypothetical protein
MLCGERNAATFWPKAASHAGQLARTVPTVFPFAGGSKGKSHEAIAMASPERRRGILMKGHTAYMPKNRGEPHAVSNHAPTGN